MAILNSLIFFPLHIYLMVKRFATTTWGRFEYFLCDTGQGSLQLESRN